MNFGLIEINSYEFNFKPFAYKLNLEGRLEVRSRYTIGTKVLSGKLNLPNQTVDLIDIVPDYKQKCRDKISYCQVFTFNTFIQLSGDKYFAREFSDVEEIPLQFSFDFDTSNLESFRAYNYFFNPNSKFKNQHRRLSDYISHIKQLKINAKLAYKNSFYIERKVGDEEIVSLSIPVSWRISDGIQVNGHRTIYVKLKNYDAIKNNYIDEWFSIKTKGIIKIDQSHISFKDGTNLLLPSSEMKQISGGKDWSAFRLNGTARKINGEYRYLQDYLNSGIFFSTPTQGVLNVRMYLLVDNHGYFISLKNPFSFAGMKHGEGDSFLKVWIQNKSDHYFANLKKFKFINL